MQSSNPTPSSLWQKLFGDPLRAFGVVSALLLALLAIAPAKNYFSEWRHYQKGYLRLIRVAGRRDHAAAPLSARNSADLASGTGRRRSLHLLSRWA